MSNVLMHAIPAELVIESKVLQELRKQSPLKVFFQSLFNLSAYVFLGLLGVWVDVWCFWPVLWWFQGFILSGFLGASHDCAHGTFGNSARTNRLAGVFWSSTVLFNFTLYKYYHLEHHNYTSVPGDTEPSGVFPSFWDYLCNLPTTGFFVSFWVMSVQAMFGRFPHFVRTEKARRAVQIDSLALLFWLLLVTTVTVLWFKYAFLFYWCPLMLYFPMVFWTSLPEHYGCDEGSDLICNTRSISSNFLFRYVFWNGNYHAEHHVYPSVPSHNLPRLHALMGKHFKFQERSYILFHLKLIWSLLRDHNSSSQVALDPLKRVDYEVYSTDEVIPLKTPTD